MGNPSPIDPATLALVGLAADIATGDPDALSASIDRVLDAEVPTGWVEELILQSVLMVGWPRTLSAAAAWRAMSGIPAPSADPDGEASGQLEWQTRGEATCRTIYGANYEPLRANVRALHPALDQWMVTEGYGRTLSRPGLDLRRRELCTVAQCAAQGAAPQLHSHLRGARHAGASDAALRAVLAVADTRLTPAARAAIAPVIVRVFA